jgi:hypothetical protein
MQDSNKTSIFLLIALGCVAACSPSTSTLGDDEAATRGTSSQALTAADVVAGFESLSAWSATSATRALTTDRVEGASALSVSNINGYAALVSDVTSGPGSVESTITLRIKPPPGHAQAYWKGMVQLFVNSPSRGLDSAFIGQADLTGLIAGTFGTVSIAVLQDVKDRLSSGSIDDVRYTLALNVPLSGPYLLDALKLGAATLDPTPTPTPTAYTGGADIAVLWEPIQWSQTTQRYDVYRDGQLIGAAPPSIYTDRPSSATYIDANVVDHGSYRYEVQAVAESGTRAARSAAVSITHSSAGAQVPTILIEDGGYPHTRPFLERGERYLKTWYPKIANILANPVYQPPSTITLRAVRNLESTEEDECGGAVGWVDVPRYGNVVLICAYDDIGSSEDVGLFVHEATHLMQDYDGPQLAAAGEGVASWAGNLATGLDNRLAAPPLGSYFDNYEYGAYFFDWIARTYDKPNFIRDLNLVCHDGTYSAAWLTQYTGQTLGQMFGTMTGTTYTSPGPLKNSAGPYAFPSDSDLTPGSRLELRAQPSTDPGRFFHGPVSGMVGPLRWEKKVCLGEDAQGFVVVENCNAESMTLWRYLGPLGAFRSEATGHCLQSQSNGQSDGTPLVTATCTGLGTQRWLPLPP